MAFSENIQITSDGIKNSLKKYKPLKAIAEYVWNGFDAKATTITIDIGLNECDYISKITVIDNGTGIDGSNLSAKFKPFFQSEKIYDPEIKHSATHGKNGVGRLTFFTFANMAEWETVYEKEGKHYQYTIVSTADNLDMYEFNRRD